MLVLGFDLAKTMMVNAVLVVQEFYNGNTEQSYPETVYLQNFNLHIGGNKDWRQNPKCPGGPFMKADQGSNGWYFDDRIGQLVWSFGVEAWCNMRG